MSKTLLQPGLLKYFEKSIGATEWNGHLLAPVLVFGNLDAIDHDEYEKAMQALVHFLECFAKHIDNTNDLHSLACLVADIHCCTRNVYALILAQLFASLYKIFEKSRATSNFVYHRYRAYLIKAIQYPESYDFTFVGPSRHQDKKSYDQLIVSLDLQIGDETRCCHDLIDSVAIGIMAERYLLQKQDTIPEGWVSKLPLWQPIHLNESMYTHDIVVRFLVDSLHCVAPSAFSEDNTTAGYFLSNFVVHVEGIPFAVHDWLIAPVFPYFEQEAFVPQSTKAQQAMENGTREMWSLLNSFHVEWKRNKFVGAKQLLKTTIQKIALALEFYFHTQKEQYKINPKVEPAEAIAVLEESSKEEKLIRTKLSAIKSLLMA